MRRTGSKTTGSRFLVHNASSCSEADAGRGASLPRTRKTDEMFLLGLKCEEPQREIAWDLLRQSDGTWTFLNMHIRNCYISTEERQMFLLITVDRSLSCAMKLGQILRGFSQFQVRKLHIRATKIKKRQHNYKHQIEIRTEKIYSSQTQSKSQGLSCCSGADRTLPCAEPLQPSAELS